MSREDIKAEATGSNAAADAAGSDRSYGFENDSCVYHSCRCLFIFRGLGIYRFAESTGQAVDDILIKWFGHS